MPRRGMCSWITLSLGLAPDILPNITPYRMPIALACLLAIFFVIMHGLWRERRHWLQNHPELANAATAFFLCLCAYAISAVFEHLSYQRYFWLLVALSSAAARIIHSQREAQGMAEPFSFQGGSL